MRSCSGRGTAAGFVGKLGGSRRDGRCYVDAHLYGVSTVEASGIESIRRLSLKEGREFDTVLDCFNRFVGKACGSAVVVDVECRDLEGGARNDAGGYAEG